MNRSNNLHIKAALFGLMLSAAFFLTKTSHAAEAPERDLTKYPCHSYTEPCGKLPPRPVEIVEWDGNLGDPERGKSIAFSVPLGNCLACHDINGGTQGGNIGPSLVNYGDRDLPHLYTYQRIHDIRVYNKGAHMPLFGTNGVLNDTQIRDVIAFLHSLKNDK